MFFVRATSGPEGRLLDGACPQVPQIYVEGQSIRIHYTPIRSGTSPLFLHQVTEASCILPSASRNQVNRLPRRYPDNGLLSREGNQRSSSGITDSGSSRVHHQHEEMPDHSNTDDRIPGVHTQLPPHGALSSQGEGLQDKEGVQADAEPDRGVKSFPCSPDRPNDSQYPSDPNSPITLSGPSETPDKRTAWQSSELRPQSPDVRGRSHGPDVVGDQAECPDTTPNSPTNGIAQPGNRRLDSRMGCVLSGVISEDRRTLVESRGSPTHQLVGIDGGIPGRPMLCQSSQRNSHPTLHGQPGGDSVCESSRRNALKEPVHTGTGILGVVRAQENHSPCGAHPRQEKRDSGLGVTSHVRLQRLATGSGSLQKGSACLRAILSGPLRELQEHSARGVLQLEARSISRSRGRTLSGVVEPPPIPISTLCTDRQKPTQGQDGQSHSGSFDCTPLASSSVVPDPHKHADSSPHSPSVLTQSSSRPSGPNTPIDNAGSPDPSRLAHIRRRLQSQGISADAASLICASWRKGTSKVYQTAWRRWVHWCDRRKVDPCSTSIGNIANFLTGIFGEGKSHSTLNTYRSAISMSHDKVDGASVGQHSALCRLLQGMYNARPPRPKHTTIWNVDQVIGHIRSRPPSKDLDLKELSCKLVTLLALANADRASDIHLLDLQYATYREDRVVFQIAGLNKTRRSGQVSYVRFPECPNTCPVETLRVYEQRTQPLRGDATSLLVACVKPHKPVATSTISRWIKNMLEQAGIHANAHSTRSAATSAAFAAGMSVKNIIDAANWAKESTFKRFYCRPVACSKSFSNTVLQGMCSIQAASSLYIML